MSSRRPGVILGGGFAGVGAAQKLKDADADVVLVDRHGRLTSDEREQLKRLRKENAELKRANAILKDASVYFATELDPTRRR